MLKLAIPLILVFFHTSSFACSCLSRTYEQHLEDADSSFIGIVESIKGKPYSATNNTDFNPQTTRLEVVLKASDVLKGDKLSSYRIFTSTSSAACGVSFQVGKRYVVFAKYASHGKSTAAPATDELTASSCGGTTAFERNYKALDEMQQKLHEFIQQFKTKR